MDSLVAAYTKYCEAQIPGNSSEPPVSQVRQLMRAVAVGLPATMQEYQSLNDELYDVWRAFVGCSDPSNGREFTTSGSTRGMSRKYRFGPHPELWIRAMWTLTRFPFGFREVIKLDHTFEYSGSLSVSSESAGKYRHIVASGPLNATMVPELLTILQEFIDTYAACSLISVPDAFLYLNEEPRFRDFAIENRDRFNLMSQHWEPFYKQQFFCDQGVHFNDTMVDWTTGFNFGTCAAGKRHVFPIFVCRDGKRINLLNLFRLAEHRGAEDEDLFVPRSISRCACGRDRLDFDFVPHPSTAIRNRRGEFVYDPHLAEQLASHFQLLQFLQERETILAFYRVEGAFRDQELIEDYFSTNGFKVEWHPNDTIQLGIKRPVFYKYPTN